MGKEVVAEINTEITCRQKLCSNNLIVSNCQFVPVCIRNMMQCLEYHGRGDLIFFRSTLVHNTLFSLAQIKELGFGFYFYVILACVGGSLEAYFEEAKTMYRVTPMEKKSCLVCLFYFRNKRTICSSSQSTKDQQGTEVCCN